jgi:hypothetical protein
MTMRIRERSHASAADSLATQAGDQEKSSPDRLDEVAASGLDEGTSDADQERSCGD